MPFLADTQKVIIYQIFTRLFGNKKTEHVKYGTIEENGVGKFEDINSKALQSIRSMGITHIWYTGVIEHAVVADYSKYGIDIDNPKVVKGRAGSPYAIKDYYDVNPDLAIRVPDRMEEFCRLVERTHHHDLKVIIDFVPNHVARAYRSDAKPDFTEDFGGHDKTDVPFHRDNNFYYLTSRAFAPPEDYDPIPGYSFITKEDTYTEIPAKATGNNVFKSNPSSEDWFETVKLNYGINYRNKGKTHFYPIPSTWHKMLDILWYWAELGVDGFRCDVPELVPAEFWRWVIPRVRDRYPKTIFIAEAFDPDQSERHIFSSGFDFIYDKIPFYDVVRGIIEKGKGTNKLSKLMSGYHERNIDDNLLRFLENHDEQRVASGFFAGDPWNAWPGMVLCAASSRGAAMIYFGQEVGEKGEEEEGYSKLDGRTTMFDYWGAPQHQKWMNNGLFDGGGLSEDQKSLRQFYANLFNLCNDRPEIVHGKFYDLHLFNQQKKAGYKNNSVYCFARMFRDKLLIIALNFSNTQQFDINLILPDHLMEIRNKELRDLLNNKSEAFQIKGDVVKLALPASAARIMEVI